MSYLQVGVALSMIFAPASASATAATANTSATNPQNSPSPAAAQAKPAKPVKYCVEMEPFTGSRSTTTECMTKEQWAREGVDVDHLANVSTR